jgi:multidrug efflux pump
VSGAGAAARNSIGLVIVSGMALGTIFTLFVLPSIYVLLAKDHNAEEAIERMPVEEPHTLNDPDLIAAK